MAENTNQTVQMLVNELNRQQNAKFDIVVDTRSMKAIPEPGRIVLEIQTVRDEIIIDAIRSAQN